MAVGLSSAAAWALLFVARTNGLVVAAAMCVMATAVALERRREAATLAAVTAVVAALSLVPALMRLWPAPLFIAVGAGLAWGRLRAPWLVLGELSGRVAAWILGFVGISMGALVAWWFLVRPDLSDMPALPSGLHPALLAGAVGHLAEAAPRADHVGDSRLGCECPLEQTTGLVAPAQLCRLDAPGDEFARALTGHRSPPPPGPVLDDHSPMLSPVCHSANISCLVSRTSRGRRS